MGRRSERRARLAADTPFASFEVFGSRIGRSNRIGNEMDARHRRGPISEGAWAASARRTTPPPLVEAPAGDV